MPKYCVECGSGLSENDRFCAQCGHALMDDSATETTVFEDLNVAEPVNEPASTKKKSRVRTGALAAGIAAVAAVLGLSFLAATSQGSQDSAAVSDAVATESPAPNDKKDSDGSQPKSNESQTPPPAPEQRPRTLAPNSSGYWEGNMRSGAYGFELQLNERPNGSVSGEMIQWDTGDGETGTQYVTGTRDGNVLRLRGQYWSADTPQTWKLDTFKLKLNRNGQSFSGTYDCDGCSSGPKGIQGFRG